MMVAVVGCPPKHALLRRTSGYKRDNKLKGAAGLERPVRKITVVTGSHKEHAHVIEGKANHKIRPMEFQKKRGDTSEMHEEKRQCSNPRNAIAALESDYTESHQATSLHRNRFTPCRGAFRERKDK